MAKKGSKLSVETLAKIKLAASQRLKDTSGNFISKEKQQTIEFLAAQNGLPKEQAQTFLYQNEKSISGYLQRGEVEATFSSRNYVKYIGNNFNKFEVNGERVSRKQMIYLITQTNNYLSREMGSHTNLFHGMMKDITPDGAQTISIKLPMRHVKGSRNKWRVERELVEEWEDSEEGEILYKQFE